MKLASGEALLAMRARAKGRVPEELSYSIDTRSLRPGETYLALVGERFDGHRFIEQAIAAGAVAAIVSEEGALPYGFPGFVVEDTRAALCDLAGVARRHFCGAIVAITGSTGKTTTKEFLGQILGAAAIGAVAVTPRNENNEIGVSKVLLGLEAEAVAVIEMGARNPDDIAPLVAIARPQIAILTNIGEAHIGVFGSSEALARTKWQIFSTGARPVLSLADATSRDRYRSLNEPPIWVGLVSDAQDAPLPGALQLLLEEGMLLLRRPGRAEARAPLMALPPGEHNARNLLAAAGAALALGVPLARIARAASRLTLPSGRYERLAGLSGVTLIHDAYNASPSGMIASLRTFAAEKGRRMILLGSMAELGEAAPAEHRRVGAALAGVDAAHIVVLGEFAKELLVGAREAGVAEGSLTRVEDTEQAIEVLRRLLRPGDIVLVKGSRVYRLERAIDALKVPAPL